MRTLNQCHRQLFPFSSSTFFVRLIKTFPQSTARAENDKNGMLESMFIEMRFNLNIYEANLLLIDGGMKTFSWESNGKMNNFRIESFFGYFVSFPCFRD